METVAKQRVKSDILSEDEITVSFFYLVVKRSMDIFLAAIGLFVLSPLLVFIAICIKIEDPKGPIFFSQLRVGKKERIFKIYKFRSMVTDAEERLKDLISLNEVSGAMFKMKQDPRVTRIGKFIRKTSIDELPQLWNVIKGDMSLVGPRPPLIREVKQYTNFEKQRLFITPGCTGLWQVSGRSNLSFYDMVKLDLEYIVKRSIWLDIKIILRTILLLVGSKNAY